MRATNAPTPPPSRYGRTGTTAPSANATNDPTAAPNGEPSSSGSSPSSSRISVSRARSGSSNRRCAIASASSAGSPSPGRARPSRPAPPRASPPARPARGRSGARTARAGDCIEMYSPAAMLNAPASRPAMPARRMKRPCAAGRRRRRRPSRGRGCETSPSLTPKITARSVPDRPERCQRSRAAMSSVGAVASSPVLQLAPDLGVLPLVGGDRRDLRRGLARRRSPPRRPRGP